MLRKMSTGAVFNPPAETVIPDLHNYLCPGITFNTV